MPPARPAARRGVSWVDALQAFLVRLPWPCWLSYLAAGTTIVSLVVVAKWFDGTMPPGRVFPYHVVSVGTGVYALALMHALDATAGQALSGFRAALDVTDDAFERIRQQLTTMPAGATLAVTAAGVTFGVLQRIFIVGSDLEAFRYSASGPAATFEYLEMLSSWAIVFVFFFHAARQTRLIDRLYRRRAIIRLFDPEPLYAFSRYSARAAVGLLVIGYAWIATYPRELATSALGLLATVVGLLTLTAFSAFLLPLWGAHQRLVDEKARRRGSVYQRWERMLERLHQGLDRGELGDVATLSTAVDTLQKEIDRIEAASTWPWRSSTLRGFLTAVLLPLVVWAVQEGITRTLLR
jgi:hypothetical protein